MFLIAVVTFVDLFATIFNGLIILRILLALLVKPENRFFIGLVNVTEPVLLPARSVLPKNSQFDFSPTVTVIALYTIDLMVSSLLPPMN